MFTNSDGVPKQQQLKQLTLDPRECQSVPVAPAALAQETAAAEPAAAAAQPKGRPPEQAAILLDSVG